MLRFSLEHIFLIKLLVMKCQAFRVITHHRQHHMLAVSEAIVKQLSRCLVPFLKPNLYGIPPNGSPTRAEYVELDSLTCCCAQ